ncbi:wah-1 [Pristionchus pacificus]|uniref:Wah-1 n=1 Tax=Pristionchus pacificus TaxID=54126 RepID=A0A2A6CCP5_PRIPA|nr:wah-1 [Pristionchus pacificus]|eukprot:PDM75972.1 wah-1 [Pristionchus pacificus]
MHNRMSRRQAPSHVGPAPHTAAQSLGFPACCDQALEQVSRVVAATAAIPAQSRSRAPNTELQVISLSLSFTNEISPVKVLLDRDLFCLNDRKVDEEEKLENDVTQKNAHRSALFETIFLGREGETILHSARIQVLLKVSSYALQHPSLSLFIPLAHWLRKMIGRNSYPDELIALLVEHFIQPDPALRLYDYLVPISSTAPEFGFIFVALAPRDNCMGFAMASVAAACLHGFIEEFLVMMCDFPDKLAVPFAKHSFSCLAKYALQKDENDEMEEEGRANNDIEMDDDDENEKDEESKENDDDDPEEGEVSTESLEERLSRALATIVNGWNVRGVNLEIDAEILSHMASNTRRRNLWSFIHCHISLSHFMLTVFESIVLSGFTMLSRLFSRRGATRSSVAALIAVRQLRTTTAVLGGHHHDEAPPPHIPRPASGERNWFGEVKPPRISEDAKYKPGKDDIYSYIGAFVGVALTVIAVKKYTLNDEKHGHGEQEGTHGKKKEQSNKDIVHEKKEEPKPVEEKKEEKVKTIEEKKEEEKIEKKEEKVEKEEKSAEEESQPESLHPVVEKKLVIVPVEVEKTHIEESVPSTSSDDSSIPSESLPVGQLPESVPYLLVGGGTASYYAALVIRARDPNARVLIISDESHLPYNRPPLSKELWWYGSDRSREHLEYKAPSGRTRDVFQEAEGFFVPVHQLPSTAHGGVSIATNKRVIRNSNEDVKKRVIYYRGVDDYRRLEEEASKSSSITIIGGGFLGSELAYSIKRKYDKMEVNQIIPDHGPLSSILPEYLSRHANEEMKKIGINVHSSSLLSSAHSSPSGNLSLSLKDKEGGKKEVQTDLIVVAIGIQPNVEVAKASGFEIDAVNGGIMADGELRVSGKVFAAGDACSYYDESLGRRRNGHWENAQISGRLAGENMTGGKTSFWYQPSFFTKIAPTLLLNAVGDINSQHETVSVYRANTESGDKYERGIVFYVKDEKIVGVLLVNLIGAGIDVARRLIKDGKSVNDFKEVAKLFPLYENDKAIEEEEKKE